MEEREKKRKILYVILGIIVILLLFFMIKSCSSSNNEERELSISKIDLAKNSIVMTIGDEEKLSYTIEPTNTNEATRWITDNSKVATVDSYGNVKAVGIGTATITLVSDKGVSDYVKVKVVSKITEDGKHVTASIIEKDVKVKVGSTKKLNYELDPADSKYIEVIWESSSPLVATVNNDGVVTGLKSGITSITAKIVLSDNTVITDTTTVTVSENASLYLTTNVPDIRIGQVIRLSASLSTNDVVLTDGTVKSSKDSIVSISNVSISDGYLTFDVKGLKAGDVTLKLTGITSEGKTINLDVPVTVVKFSELFISSGNKQIKTGDSFILSGRLDPSIDGSLDTLCKSSNEKAVSVVSTSPSGEYNGACQITGINEGSSTITITISGQKQTIKVTVKNDNVSNPDNPDNPNNPNDPSNPDNPNDPSNPDNPVGSASLSVSLDKTTYSINDKAVITVKFTDEKGNTKTLSENEYTIATEFDSSSLGTKKLIVVYPYGESSLKAEVEYTISGGSSSGNNSGNNPGGNYPSGGGGSNNTNPDKTTEYLTTSIKLVGNNKQNADGSYDGIVNAEVKIQGKGVTSTDIAMFSFRCKDGVSRKTCDDVFNDSTRFHPQMLKNELFELVDARYFGSNEINGEYNVAGEYVAVFRNELDDKTWKSEKNYLTKNDGDELYKVASIFMEDKNFAGGTRIIDENDNSVIIRGDIPENLNGIPTDKKGGNVDIAIPNKWISSNDQSTEFSILVRPYAGWEIRNMTYNINGVETDKGSTSLVSAAVTGPATITATATFINSDNLLSTVTKTKYITVDDTIPKCSATYDSNTTTITVYAYDESNQSLIKSLVPTTTLGNRTTFNSSPYFIGYKYNATANGKVSFTVTDEAGNEGTCSTDVTDTFCFTWAGCGYKEDKSNCKACKEAGCQKDGENVAGLYECTPIDKNKNLKTQYIYHILDKEEITIGTTNPEDTPIKYDYKTDNISSITIDNNEYSCKFGPKLAIMSGEYDPYTCIEDTFVKADSVFRKENSEKYNRNCAICGCDEGNWTNWFDEYHEVGNNKPAITGSYLQIYKIKKSSVPGDCSNVKNDDTSESKFWCNSLANGATINGEIVTCN